MDSDKLKKLSVFVGIILVIFLIFRYFSSNNDNENFVEKVKTKKKKSYSDVKLALNKNKKKDRVQVKKKKVALRGDLTRRRSALEESIENLTKKLEKCRNQVLDIVKEEDIQKIEKEIWAMEDNEKGPSGNEIKEAEAEILEKLGALTSMEWHMDELGKVTEDLMNEEMATSDPDWTLDIGAKIQPCGVYQAHRLLSIWTELVPQASKNAKEASFVEESVVNYTKNMLKHSLGAAGVAMQLELMAALSEKGYFNTQMREQIGELERRMHQEMDARFEDTDGNSRDLVMSVVRDFQENETARQEAMDLINQHYPDY